MAARRGQEEPTPSHQKAVTFFRPGGHEWGFIVVCDSFPAEDVESSWNDAVERAEESGYRGDILFECPDVIHREYAFYLLAA